MKGMGNLMKQAQKLQTKMLKLQEELADKTVETTSGGGMVKVVANGKQQVVSIEIEKEVVDPDDVDISSIQLRAELTRSDTIRILERHLSSRSSWILEHLVGHYEPD